MFDPQLLARAGIQSQADNYPDWLHRHLPFRVWNRAGKRWSYKRAESIRLILLSKNAKT